MGSRNIHEQPPTWFCMLRPLSCAGVTVDRSHACVRCNMKSELVSTQKAFGH